MTLQTAFCEKFKYLDRIFSFRNLHNFISIHSIISLISDVVLWNLILCRAVIMLVSMSTLWFCDAYVSPVLNINKNQRGTYPAFARYVPLWKFVAQLSVGGFVPPKLKEVGILYLWWNLGVIIKTFCYKHFPIISGATKFVIFSSLVVNAHQKYVLL